MHGRHGATNINPDESRFLTTEQPPSGQNPSERDQLVAKAKDRIVVHEGPWATVMLLIFNTSKKPFDDIRVRQALSLAIDRYSGSANLSKISIMKHVGGIMRPGSEWALPEAELEKQVGYSRDIEKSRAEAETALDVEMVADPRMTSGNQ